MANLAKEVGVLEAAIRELAKVSKIHPSKVTYAKFKQASPKYYPNLVVSASEFNTFRDSIFPRRHVEDNDIVFAKAKAVADKNHKNFDKLIQEQSFLQQFKTVGEKIFANHITPTGYALNTKKVEKERELNLILSDLHFGANLDPSQVPYKYSRQEEARRLAAIVKQVCEYKVDHRKHTTLNLHILGDIIQNQLHDPRDGDMIAFQVCDAIWLLNQAISIFAANFPKVYVRCATGNHGRNTGRHQNRAIVEKVDSLETMIYYALKMASSQLKNVVFEIPTTPYIQFDSFGMKAFGTHGDTIINPGNPGNSINVRGIENQINRINASLNDTDEYKLFFVGHVHVGSFTQLGNGTAFITNGCLIPPDNYTVSLGIFENSCGQTLYESVNGHIVGDYRFIRVDANTDRDNSLDDIIQPFRGLND